MVLLQVLGSSLYWPLFDYHYSLKAIRNDPSFVLIHLHVYGRDWQTGVQGQI